MKKRCRDQSKDIPPPLSCEKNSELQIFGETMRPSVWLLRVKIPKSKLKCKLVLEDNLDYKDSDKDNDKDSESRVIRLQHMYTSGVCVSGRKCIIMTSSQILQISQKYAKPIMGQCFFGGNEGSEYKKLKVLFSDTTLGIVLLEPKKKNQIPYPYASISDEILNPGSIVKIIGHPLSVKFPLLVGRITSESCFDVQTLSDSSGFRRHKTYTNVADIMRTSSNNLDLDKPMGITLNLSKSRSNPLLTIQNMYHRNGVAGSPIFDDEGFLRGLVCFGDETFTYGIPSQHIVYHLKSIGHQIYNHISLKNMESGEGISWNSDDVSEGSNTRDDHGDRRGINPRLHSGQKPSTRMETTMVEVAKSSGNQH